MESDTLLTDEAFERLMTHPLLGICPYLNIDPCYHIPTKIPSKKSRNRKCGRCETCIVKDCGKCKNCEDKLKFGGTGVRKQACLNRSECRYKIHDLNQQIGGIGNSDGEGD